MYRKNDLIALYLNEKDELFFIPTIVKNGPHIIALPFQKMEIYIEKDIGIMIKKVFQMIYNNELTEADKKVKIHESISGIKSYKNFSKKHLHVTVIQFHDNGEYCINHMPRTKDGSYGAINDIEKEFSTNYYLPYTAADEELGEIIIKAFEDGKRYQNFIN